MASKSGDHAMDRPSIYYPKRRAYYRRKGLVPPLELYTIKEAIRRTGL